MLSECALLGESIAKLMREGRLQRDPQVEIECAKRRAWCILHALGAVDKAGPKYATEVQALADIIIGGNCVPAPFQEVVRNAKLLKESERCLEGEVQRAVESIPREFLGSDAWENGVKRMAVEIAKLRAVPAPGQPAKT